MSYTIEVSEPIYRMLNQQAQDRNSSLEKFLEYSLTLASSISPVPNKIAEKWLMDENVDIAQLIESATYVTDEQGQQTDVTINVDLWHKLLDSLRSVPIEQPIEDIEEEADENDTICREELAFRRLHPSLLETHKGQFVAIYQEHLVDHDEDQIALYLRVDEQYPDQFVLIAPVNEQAEEVYHFRSPRVQELPDVELNGQVA